MALSDYIVRDDKFELDQSGPARSDLCFPCNICEHNMKSDSEQPCIHCGHNLNYRPEAIAQARGGE
jgi:hypothetical protein